MPNRFPSWEAWEMHYYEHIKIMFFEKSKIILKTMWILKPFPKLPNLGMVRHLEHGCCCYLGNQMLFKIIVCMPCLWLKHFPTWEGGSAFRNAPFLVGKNQ